MHQFCDLLITSTDVFLPEALLTIGQLEKLGFTQRFSCHLMMGEQRPVITNVRLLNRLKKGTWSSELREALLQLQKPFVLLWLDDFIPLSSLPLSQIIEMVDSFIAKDGNYLRLNPSPPGNGQISFKAAREILPGEIYRASTIYAIWRREVLLSLLDDKESAWQFEFSGSRRSDRYRGFYSSDVVNIDCINLVIKGLMDPRAEKKLISNGISTAGILRKRMSKQRVIYLQFLEFRSLLLNLLPWKWRAYVRGFFSTDLKTQS